MIQTAFASALLIPLLSLANPTGLASTSPTITANHTMSLDTRYAVPSVNQVFKDNILLTLGYLRGSQRLGVPVDWNATEQPFHSEFTLKPGETFAFHDDVLPQYKDKISLTTNAHYSGNEGFKSDGYLMGDGVCHLASLMTWVAKDAGLDVNAPTNHDFANIPEVPKEFGTAIYTTGTQSGAGAMQNLYITNNHGKDVTFVWDYNGHDLNLKTEEK